MTEGSGVPVGSLETAAQTDQGSGHPRKWLILAVVSLGMFMTLLDATIVNIAVPAIIADLHSTVTKVSWVLNAYSLALGVLFLSMGRLADRYGLRRVFLAGLGVFTLFSLFCGFSPNIDWLIGFRVGQAVGGAAMAPISLAILLHVFPLRQRGIAVAVWGALGGVAAAVGPTLGGILVTYGAWHWIFFVNVPIGLVALAAVFWVVPEWKGVEGTGGIDLPGIVISTAGLFFLTLALIQGNAWGWGSAAIVGLLLAAVISYPLFVWWELRTDSPMFDLRLLRIRSFTAANSAMLALGTALGGSLFLLVIFMVTVLGYSELRAAVVLTAMPAVALLLGPMVGRGVDRVGPRYPAALGAGFFALGMLLLSQMDASASTTDIVWRMGVLGLGIGFGMPTLSSAAVSSLPTRSRGVGAGALNMMRQVGFTLGIAILVSIFSHTVAQAVRSATAESVRYVQSQPLPAPVRSRIIQDLQKHQPAAGSARRPRDRCHADDRGCGAGGGRPPAGGRTAASWRRTSAPSIVTTWPRRSNGRSTRRPWRRLWGSFPHC